MSVFKVNKDFTIIANEEAAKLVPELCSLSSDQLLYVVLAVDYVDGPFRKYPFDERKLLASRRVFGKDSIKQDERITLAMDAYKGLIFDIRRETIDKFKAKINQLHEELLGNITPSAIQNIDKSITFLEKRIASLEADISASEKEEIELKGGKRLSMIETWQRNQMRYSEYKSQK